MLISNKKSFSRKAKTLFKFKKFFSKNAQFHFIVALIFIEDE